MSRVGSGPGSGRVGSRQQVFKVSGVGSGRVASGRVGPEYLRCYRSGRVGFRIFSNLTGRVGSHWPGPT